MNPVADVNKHLFIEEAQELLTELEAALLELEYRPDDGDLVARVFRALHTIKGSGAMFGFETISTFLHDVESVFDHVRSGAIPVTSAIVELGLSAGDEIARMLGQESPRRGPETERLATLCKSLLQNQLSDVAGRLSEDSPGVAPAFPDLPPHAVTYRIRFKPGQDVFTSGVKPLLLLKELQELGTCSITAHLDAVPPLLALDPEACYVYWDMVVTTELPIEALRDIFIFVEDQSELDIQAIDNGFLSGEEQDCKKLGDILVERGDMGRDEVEAVLRSRKLAGEMLVDAGFVTQSRVDSALREQKHVRGLRQKRESDDPLSSIRVPSEKLDALVNLVGELVTLQARLTETASVVNNSQINAIAEEAERLTTELRDQTLTIRMLPIGATFGRFKRLIRDLSRDLGKEIEMVTEGADTELDKTVLERLNDPLVHMIRNSIDHGIEPPQVRETLGKPKAGRIWLAAQHSGAQVLLEVKDDGAGLDPEVIRNKAVEKGLITQDAQLSEEELFSLVMTPGFSTAKSVTNISGRGVGMDVVKKAIDALGGSIAIASKRGTGTTISIRLPLTLAIVDGLLVRIAEDHFVLPLSIVEECVELTGDDTGQTHEHNIANIRGHIIPFVRLRDAFDVRGESPSREQIVVTEINDERVGFVVDDVIGQHQTVIKNLGRHYRNVAAVSGATILGNGTVALIIDAPSIIKAVKLSEAFCA